MSSGGGASAASGASSSFARAVLIALTKRKMAKATIRKSTLDCRNSPQPMKGCPLALAAATEDGSGVADLDAAGQCADDRHNDVAHERGHDFAEGGADDDADGQIDDVATHGELFEFFEHAHGNLQGG